WKFYTAATKAVKERIQTSQKWLDKANENRDFLTRIFTAVKAKPSIFKSMSTCLWSTTYLVALRECETFWPAGDNIVEADGTHIATEPPKQYVTRIITDPADWQKIQALACWVWEERFLR